MTPFLEHDINARAKIMAEFERSSLTALHLSAMLGKSRLIRDGKRKKRKTIMKKKIGAMLLLLYVSPPLWAGNDVVGVPSEALVQCLEVDEGVVGQSAKRLHTAQNNKAQLFRGGWLSPDRKKSILDTGKDYVLQPHNVSIGKYHSGYEDTVWDQSSRYLVCAQHSPKKSIFRVIDTGDPKGLWVKEILSAQTDKGYTQVIEMNAKSQEVLFQTVDWDNKNGVYSLFSIALKTLKKKLIYQSDHFIDFASFSPDAQSLVFGTSEGVILAQKRKALRKLFEMPGLNIVNLDWAPNSEHLLLRFRRGFKSKKYGLLKGVALVNFQEKKAKRFVECFAPKGRFHTLWFSKDGKRFGFAKEECLWLRHTDQIGVAPKELTPLKGNLAIKGFAFNSTGDKIAVTAGPELWIYDLRTGRGKVHRQFGKPLYSFLSQPYWEGKKIFVTHILDSNAR